MDYKWIKPTKIPCKSLGLYPTYEPWDEPPSRVRLIVLVGFYYSIQHYWLVVSTYPSEKWWSESQLGWLFPIYGKNKNVPNHQPENSINRGCCNSPCLITGKSSGVGSNMLSHTIENHNIRDMWDMKDLKGIAWTNGIEIKVGSSTFNSVWDNHTKWGPLDS